ncbi:MAG: GPW/gp25 family protein [Clostridia bacterium]
MRYTIDASDMGALRFAPPTVEEEIIQNIWVILNTPKNSVPCYRDFGTNMAHTHNPVTLAKTMYAKAASEAIKAFEPRARLLNVSFKDDAEDMQNGILHPILEVEIDE